MATLAEVQRAQQDGIWSAKCDGPCCEIDDIPVNGDWSPPYVPKFTLARELRERLEAPNRATMARLQDRMRKERQRREWAEHQIALHHKGQHMPGYCPLCGPNIFYD